MGLSGVFCLFIILFFEHLYCCVIVKTSEHKSFLTQSTLQCFSYLITPFFLSFFKKLNRSQRWMVHHVTSPSLPVTPAAQRACWACLTLHPRGTRGSFSR